MPEPVDNMLASERGFTVAAAGCGKTQLIGQIVADKRSGRQLVLTHTHAGVAAIRRRLADLKVPASKFHLDTIAGWCLRYGASYPGISGVRPDAEATPDWDGCYPGAEQVIATKLGSRVLAQSYDGVLVDEYQDCSVRQHGVIEALAEHMPCRAVGDPLQSIFGFRDDDPCVTWDQIRSDFEVVGKLSTPWRWAREGRNATLGAWLVEAREELENTGQLKVDAAAPVRWVQHQGDDAEVWSTVCRELGAPGESSVAILKWRSQSVELAKRMGGRWPIVEAFDNPDLLQLAAKVAVADGGAVVTSVFEFLAARMTRISTDLRRAVDAAAAKRPTGRFTTHLDHLARLEAMASSPTPESILAFVEGALANPDWWLYRPECVHQLRHALRECVGSSLAGLPDAAAAARTRARHRGRRMYRRSIGTPLLVKGLEFDHAAVLWEPRRQTLEGLYVAITRASKSLTIVARSRTLIPGE